MPKSRHRKGHKQKTSRRTQSLQLKRQQTMSLVQQLEEQLKIIQDNPITGVNITPQESISITGTLPSQEINL